MAKRMLIDATHPEETRVVVLNGTRLEEFDFETSTKKQIKGNIYLAKVTRVEPSLQAAFVEYGGNRHGFLAFSEIHPDYYRIPVSDREAMAADERPSRNAPDRTRSYETRSENGDQTSPPDAEDGGSSEEAENESSHPELDGPAPESSEDSEETALESPSMAESMSGGVLYAPPDTVSYDDSLDHRGTDQPYSGYDEAPSQQAEAQSQDAKAPEDEFAEESAPEHPAAENPAAEYSATEYPAAGTEDAAESFSPQTDDEPSAEAPEGSTAAEVPSGESESRTDQNDSGFVESRQVVETLGGDEIEEDQQPPRYHHRHYKVQEVIKRRQILLIQVTKEERGNKGAALTTYLSLAGRYCVLMPNAGRRRRVGQRTIPSWMGRRETIRAKNTSLLKSL